MRNHLFLLLILFPVFHSCARPEGKKLNAVDFSGAIDSLPDEWIIDVRTKNEFEGGHIANAINIDFYANDFQTRLAELPKDKPLMIYCLSGSRSAAAAAKLSAMGYDKLYHLEGGIQSWKQAGLPLAAEKKKNDTFTPEHFTRLVSQHRFIMFDFYAPWCLPCRKMKPAIEKLESEFKGKVHIERINTDEAATLARQKNVVSLPVLIFIADGIEKIRLTGYQPEEDMRSQLNALISNH